MEAIEKSVATNSDAVEVGFVRNVRNEKGWKTLKLSVEEMQALDLYIRNRQFFIASQIVQDVKSLSKQHRLGATERAGLMRAMFERRCEPMHLLVEHLLSHKSAKFHENGGVSHA